MRAVPTATSRLLCTSAVFGIDVYQKWMSPWKGFSCPHRLLHGGPSCSAHIKALIIDAPDVGLRRTLALSLDRFRACNFAANTLVEQSGRPKVRCYVIPCCLPF
jgi:putative component of membrane protein insertase Oxa1/YidC/SpoIIIJ protein YidD